MTPTESVGKMESAANTAPAESDLLFTTNPGIEDVVVAELADRAADMGFPEGTVTRATEPVRGRVRARVPAPGTAIRPAALAMRSVHHVMRPLTALCLPGGESTAPLAEAAASLEMPDLTPDTPFRVTAERSGDHDFTSQQVQAAVGAAVQQRTGAPVSLTNHAVEVRVDIVDTYARLSLQWTRRPLSMRHPMVYRQRVSLRATVAYAAARLAGHGLHAAPARIGDPFCGTGTFLMEAGALFPEAALIGGDRNPRAVAGARANLDAAGLGDRAAIEHLDARALPDTWAPESFDLVLANPPYGRRMGRDIVFEPFYGDVLAQMRRVLRPGGRAAVLVDRRARFQRAVHRIGGLGIPHMRVIQTSGTFPALVVLEKRG